MQQERCADSGRLEPIAIKRHGSKSAAAPEVRAIRDPDDRKTFEIRGVRQVLEKRQRGRACDRELHWTDAGQSFEALEIGVVQNARVSHDGDGDVTRIDPPTLLRPERRAVVEIARLEAE